MLKSTLTLLYKRREGFPTHFSQRGSPKAGGFSFAAGGGFLKDDMNKRVLKTKHFNRWMKKTELTDKALCDAVDEMQQGLIDADLGGNLYKKRVGIANRGKRGGVRTLLATNLGNRWFFLFGFEKNEKANITLDEKDSLLLLTKELLQLSEELLNARIALQKYEEICI